MTQKQPIFCVTFAKMCNGCVVDVDHEYQHADDSRRAEFNFRVAHGQELASKKMKIVGVAPAIGMFVDDKGQVSL
jgi:hypothetical protein